jgi:hypothetical protein
VEGSYLVGRNREGLGLKASSVVGTESPSGSFATLRGCDFSSLLGKVVGTASKIQGFFASLRMTNKKVTGSQGRLFGDDNQKGNRKGKDKSRFLRCAAE